MEADAPQPILFKRKGAKHRDSQRTRAMDVDAASGETATGTGDDSPSVIASKLKNKHKSRTKPKAKTTLSFGADEDEVRGLYCTGGVCADWCYGVRLGGGRREMGRCLS